MKITRTDAILITLSAMVGFVAVADISVLAAVIAGAPSGALGGIIGCIILHLRHFRRR